MDGVYTVVDPPLTSRDTRGFPKLYKVGNVVNIGLHVGKQTKFSKGKIA